MNQRAMDLLKAMTIEDLEAMAPAGDGPGEKLLRKLQGRTEATVLERLEAEFRAYVRSAGPKYARRERRRDRSAPIRIAAQRVPAPNAARFACESELES